MSESQINSLQVIASASEVIGSGYAIAVLNLIGAQEINNCNTPVIQSSEPRLAQITEQKAAMRSLMSLSPNPTDGIIHAVYELPKEYHQASLEIHNVLGQMVGQFELNSPYLISIDCGSYNSGIYFVSLKVNHEVVESQRLSVITK